MMSEYYRDKDDGLRMAASSATEIPLKRIIMARKVERKAIAEEKKQLDMQRINDMNSAIGIDPRHIFPNEIWAKIFNDLSPEDRESVWRVHPLFRDLMESNRIRDILFPKMLKVNKFVECIKEEEFAWKYLRGISKSMRNSFDCWMDDNLVKLVQSMEDIDTCPWANLVLLQPFDGPSQVLDRLLASFHGENCAKRFFCRSLLVRILEDDRNTPEIIAEFKTRVITLLKIIGEQIWHFEFAIDDLIPGMYILLHECLSLMPNLKTLEISLDSNDDGLNRKNKMLAARALLRKYPVPCLPSLEKLSIQFYHENEKKDLHLVYEALLEAYPHIKNLHLQGVDMIDFQYLPVALIKSLNLINICDSDSSIFEWIKSNVSFNWPLSTINFDVFCNIRSLFRFLEHFRSTLKKLTFNIPEDVKIENSDKFGYLDLPNLVNLDILIFNPDMNYESNIHFFFSLQFLLKCKKLKTLKWTIGNFDNAKLRKHLVSYECPRKMIDFRAGLRNLYESNVWDLFQYLENVETHFYQRGQDEDCSEEYHRQEEGSKGVSVGDFWSSHICCVRDSLQNCAILPG